MIRRSLAAEMHACSEQSRKLKISPLCSFLITMGTNCFVAVNFEFREKPFMIAFSFFLYNALRFLRST